MILLGLLISATVAISSVLGFTATTTAYAIALACLFAAVGIWADGRDRRID